MSVARHPRPPELVDTPIEEIMDKFVGRFREKKPDWAAFEDAKIEGFKRAQHRFIGSGASGKADASVIPAQHFTLSVMFIPPGQGNAPHTHEVEEVFFILEGKMLVFIEDGAGNRAETVLGPWDCVSCPANVIHGFTNVGLEPAYLQVMLGKAKPELMTYTDGDLQSRRDEHLRAAGSRG
jgi:mannose-6-phosphate isomerase-like protein (cupin superfamily)